VHYPLCPGVNFRPRELLPADVLCAALARTVSFLQHPDATLPLWRFEDWLQHDGLMFEKGGITFHDVFRFIDTPRSLLAAMKDDHAVRLGVAPARGAVAEPWYLRFILEWDADEANLEGEFDLTLAPAAAVRYRREVVDALQFPTVEVDAAEYYRRITESG
jgi:hypothetical protein